MRRGMDDKRVNDHRKSEHRWDNYSEDQEGRKSPFQLLYYLNLPRQFIYLV
jgi:hypothetical protein